MTTPVRLRLSRAKGFDLQDASRAINGLPATRVSRPGPWGNPFNLRDAAHGWTALAQGFRADPAGRHACSVALFEAWVRGGKAVEIRDCGLYHDNPITGARDPVSTSPAIEAPAPPSLTAIRAALAGRNLACWCRADQPCHADVLLNIANGGF